MKKLLSLLGAVAIGASSASIVVSCSYAPNMDATINREANYYSTISADALKAGVLADQNFNIQGQKSGVGIDFSSSYYSSQLVSKVYKNLYNPDAPAGPKGDAEASSLFKSVFGTSQGGDQYTIKNSFYSLKNGGVKKGSNLDKIINATENGQTANVNLKQPDSGTASTLNLVAGFGKIVFANDFDSSIGQTLISILTSGTAKSALSAPAIPGIFSMIDGILNSNQSSIKNAINSITQSEIADEADKNKATYKDQLSSSTQDLFKGLIYLISNKKSTYKEGSSDTPAETFWKFLLNPLDAKDDLQTSPLSIFSASLGDDNIISISLSGDTTGLSKQDISLTSNNKTINISDAIKDISNDVITIDANKIDGFLTNDSVTSNKFILKISKDKNPDEQVILTSSTSSTAASVAVANPNLNDLINSISGMASFAITLLHYFRAFDQKYKLNYPPRDGNHIFSPDKYNGEAIEDVLEQWYVGDDFKPTTVDSSRSEDDFWYYDGQTYSTKLNLQNLISDLQYYFSPVENDTKGYQTLRAFNILLGSPYIPGTESGFNPILETALTPGIKALGPIISNALSAIPSTVLPPSVRDSISNDIANIGKKGVQEILEWLLTDGGKANGGQSSLMNTVKGLIQPITDALSKINLSQFAGDEKTKEILAIISAVANYLSSSRGNDLFKAPWTKMFSGGLISDISSVMRSLAKGDKSLIRIADGMRNLRDIKTLLTKNISFIVQNIAKMADNSSIALPDWLYNFKDTSISNLLDYFANTWLAKDDKQDTSNNYNSNMYNKLSDNNRYNFDTAAIGNIVTGLIPNDEINDKTDLGSGIVLPTPKEDNSEINVLSAVLDNGTLVITLSNPLVARIKASDITIAGKTLDEVKGISISGLDSGSSAISISFDGTQFKENDSVSIDGFKNTQSPIKIVPSDNDSVVKKTVVYYKDGTSYKPVTPLMPLYYSIMYYNSDKDLKDIIPHDYYVKLKGEMYTSAPHEIASPTPFQIDYTSTGAPQMSNISSQSFENLLGINDTGDTTSFKDGSLLMGISNLYGHWSNKTLPYGLMNPNANAAEALFSLFSALSDFAGNSISALTNDEYQKYFDPKRWSVINVRQTNLDIPDGDYNVTQRLEYDIVFNNPDQHRDYTYHVVMTRPASSSPSSGDISTGWIVRELMRQN